MTTTEQLELGLKAIVSIASVVIAVTSYRTARMNSARANADLAKADSQRPAETTTQEKKTDDPRWWKLTQSTVRLGGLFLGMFALIFLGPFGPLGDFTLTTHTASVMLLATALVVWGLLTPDRP